MQEDLTSRLQQAVGMVPVSDLCLTRMRPPFVKRQTPPVSGFFFLAAFRRMA
jgi:hypothetical protein